MPANKPIDQTPVQTRGRTQVSSDPEIGKSPISKTPKGWATGLPFFDVSRWSFWASNEPNTNESKPESGLPEKEVLGAGVSGLDAETV